MTERAKGFIRKLSSSGPKKSLKEVEFNYGEKIQLLASDTKVTLGLAWDIKDGEKVDLDASAALFNRDGNYVDTCFFNNLTIGDGVVCHSGDVRDGNVEGWDESISVDLKKAVDHCPIIVFVLNAYDGGNFQNVEKASSSLLDEKKRMLVKVPLTLSGEHTSITFGILYFEPKQNTWFFRRAGAMSMGRNIKEVMSVVRAVIKDTIPSMKLNKTIDEQVNQLNFIKSVNLHENRDYIILVDQSASMEEKWQQTCDIVDFLAPHCVKADTDGITVYFFDKEHTRHVNVTSAEQVNSLMKQVVFTQDNSEPNTNLLTVLKAAFLERTEKPLTLLVITDGNPDDKTAVKDAIIHETKKIKQQEDLSISFIQLGSDPDASYWLKYLDEKLEDVGGRFDIVDSIKADQVKDIGFEQLIEHSIYD
eukprot:Lithocolla_globosa_v1_NODE_1922_length_2258_cov_11.191557.p1 type:complete len:419 gc:universal NODE_1922_length_2258_cov_11.191557:2062-806(-)